MKIRQVSFLLIVLMSLSFSAFAQNEGGKSPTDEKIELYENTAKLNLGSQYYLESLFRYTGIPAGIIFAENEDVYKKFEYKPQVLTLREALDLFTKSKPEYSWKETDGVINISPKKDYPIFDARISEFKVEDEFPWNMAQKLTQTKEFQQYLKERGLVDKLPDADKYGFFFSGGGRPDPRQKMSVNLKNATVREILNEIVRKSENRFWTYQEYEVIFEGKTYKFYRLKS